MLKREELENPDSCFNRAGMHERLFVILERDVAAPGTVRDWCKRRIWEGKNNRGDQQIVEALAWARAVEIAQKGKLGDLCSDRRERHENHRKANSRIEDHDEQNLQSPPDSTLRPGAGADGI